MNEFSQITFDDITPSENELNKELEMSVVQKNELIERKAFTIEKSPQTKPFTLVENKIFLYILSKIKPTDDIFETQYFYINDFFRVCDIKTGTKSYNLVKDSLLSIGSKAFWLKSEDRLQMVRIFDEVEIIGDKLNARIKVKLDKKLEPYLLQLQGKYTQYTLRNVVYMTSKYSIRIYEILKSYVYKSEIVVFEIGKLKDLLECYHYTDKNIYAFKIKVIEKAVEEINRYTDLEIKKVEYIKTGRAITHIKFYIHDLDDVEFQSAADREELFKRKNFKYLNEGNTEK